MPVVFIHGVSVRDDRYATLLADVRKGLKRALPGVAVHGVYWGEYASELRFKGATIPGFIAGSDVWSGVDDMDLILLLLEDPLHELAEIARAGDASGQPANSVVRAQRNAQLEHLRKPVLDALCGVRTELLPKPDRLSDDAVLGIVVATFDAAQATRGDKTAQDLIGPLTRSLTAGIYRAAVPATDLDPDFSWREAEERVGGILERELEGTMGPLSWAFQTTTTALLQKGLRRRLMAGMSLFIGDVLHYMSNRDEILGHVSEDLDEICDADDSELWLVGHSLGGIIAYEYSELGRRKVTRLVTVGSQVGLLAEMGAVHTPRDTGKQPLPAGTERWINIYDEADMLSFLAEPLFGDAEDVAVKTGAPFPGSHSEYWRVPEVYGFLARRVRA